MCTGRPPFRADGSLAVLRRVCDDTPRPFRELQPEVPDWLAELIARLHAKDPADRPGSAEEVRTLLELPSHDLAGHRTLLRDWHQPQAWLIAAGSAAAAAGLGFAFSGCGIAALDKIRSNKSGQCNRRIVAAGARDLAGDDCRESSPLAAAGAADHRPHDFYYPEYGPVRQLLESTALSAAWLQRRSTSACPTTRARMIPVTPDLLLADAKAADYDAIYFCGGEGSLDYAEGGRSLRRGAAVDSRGTRHEVHRGGGGHGRRCFGRSRRDCAASGQPAIPSEVRRAFTCGGSSAAESELTDDAVVEDGPFMTGRAPQDVRLFTDNAVETLGN